ncbi:hypothetical protein [Actinomadura rubrisoli]|uniref:YbaB/EbfC family nucleoid-associated protein n=1 Tax=Actinomadura rubrisoli TaxID=2530368 RepID=A0A4V2YYV2_9ACTN|nr:hypothetical protein [Actinomadura rubrisoli]TDD94647.1 hypothetical protein E1298_06600 [Actinomadura rubrisoli]
MAAEDDSANELNALLNTDISFAPRNAEEVQERLASGKAGHHEESPAASVGTEAADPRLTGTETSAERPLFGGSTIPIEPPPPPVEPFSLFSGAQELLAELEGLTSLLQATQSTTDSFTGEDHSGTIRVTLAADGSFEGISFRRPWRKALAIEAFDPAVSEAISNAVMARVTGMLSAMDDPRPAPAGHSAPMPRAGTEPTIDADSALRQANLLFAEFTEALTIAQSEMDSAVPDQEEVRSESGRVVMYITNDTITGVSTHQGWLKAADESRITNEFASAFEAANSAIRKNSAEPASRSLPGLQRISQVTQELQDLTSRLGFRFPGG